MIVTDIVDISKKQCKIWIDHEFAFVLYKGELHLYGLKIDREIDEQTYNQIINQVLMKRCKLRAMNLLKERMYSEKKLKDKLVAGQYPLCCVESAMEYVKSYGYINDNFYAENFLFYHGASLNKKQIFLKLRQKGLDDEIIQNAYSKFCEDGNQVSDVDLINKLLKKKHFKGIENSDKKEREKMIRSLLSKGFSYDSIRMAMGAYVLDITTDSV